MVMGYQRSGTNALFNCFVRSGECIPFLDGEANEIYDDFFLRPEPDIRTILHSQAKPVLLKPVNETKKRNIDSIFAEYSNYDVRIAYIYRDPVNSFFSQIEMWPQFTDVEEFIQLWNRRNMLALQLSPEWKTKFAIVKYQDLSDDPAVFDAICSFYGIRGTYLFRGDKNRGRDHLSKEVQIKIDAETRETLLQLDQARSFLPGKRAFSFRRLYTNSRFFVIQKLRKLQFILD